MLLSSPSCRNLNQATALMSAGLAGDALAVLDQDGSNSSHQPCGVSSPLMIGGISPANICIGLRSYRGAAESLAVQQE